MDHVRVAVENVLLDGETLLADVTVDGFSSGTVPLDPFASRCLGPRENGRLFLTSRRLIVCLAGKVKLDKKTEELRPSRIWSIPGIVGLSEQLVWEFHTDPYYAFLYLSGGRWLYVQVAKKEQVERALELSRFCNLALATLQVTDRDGGAEIALQEAERRRRND